MAVTIGASHSSTKLNVLESTLHDMEPSMVSTCNVTAVDVEFTGRCGDGNHVPQWMVVGSTATLFRSQFSNAGTVFQIMESNATLKEVDIVNIDGYIGTAVVASDADIVVDNCTFFNLRSTNPSGYGGALLGSGGHNFRPITSRTPVGGGPHSSSGL